MPGLKLMTRYISGTGIDRGALSDNSESERNVYLSYVIQEGPLKNLGVELRNINVKFRHGNDYGENRLITTYTWKFW